MFGCPSLGWSALRERALQWPPERAAAVCAVGLRPRILTTPDAAVAKLRATITN